MTFPLEESLGIMLDVLEAKQILKNLGKMTINFLEKSNRSNILESLFASFKYVSRFAINK